MPIAILIDGAYFLRRFSHTFPDLNALDADDVAYGVEHLAAYHVAIRMGPKPTLAALEAGDFLAGEHRELYRIFFYD